MPSRGIQPTTATLALRVLLRRGLVLRAAYPQGLPWLRRWEVLIVGAAGDGLCGLGALCDHVLNRRSSVRVRDNARAILRWALRHLRTAEWSQLGLRLRRRWSADDTFWVRDKNGWRCCRTGADGAAEDPKDTERRTMVGELVLSIHRERQLSAEPGGASGSSSSKVGGSTTALDDR